MKPALFATALVAVAALHPSPADACSPPAPGLYATTPADGETYPANAYLLFDGHAISLDDVTVTVDGEAGELVQPAGGEALSQLRSLIARVVPEPLPGQEVVVSGRYCVDDFGDCEATTFSFIASEPDATGPDLGDDVDVRYDVYDHQTTDPSPGACQEDRETKIFVRIDSELDVASEPSPVFWFVTGTAGGMPVFDRSIRATSSALDLTFDINDMDNPAALCVSVGMVDAAGNPIDTAPSSCLPCMYRNDDDGGIHMGEIEEPAWAFEDAYPAGTCDSDIPPDEQPNFEEQGDPPEDLVVTAGCACTAAPRDAGTGGWLVSLVAAAAIAHRRKRQTR